MMVLNLKMREPGQIFLSNYAFSVAETTVVVILKLRLLFFSLPDQQEETNKPIYLKPRKNLNNNG